MKKIFLVLICSIILLQADAMVDANKTKVFSSETPKWVKEKINKKMKCGSGKCGAVKIQTH